MTPELKTACELVFQEHKTVSQVKWNKNVFTGKISIGLTEMARETLVEKKVIFIPDKSRKVITLLNPTVAGAQNFEEAIDIIGGKLPGQRILGRMVQPAAEEVRQPSPQLATRVANHSQTFSDRTVPAVVAGSRISKGLRWYMKPIFYYLAWPVCAAVLGAIIAYLLGLVYTKIILGY